MPKNNLYYLGVDPGASGGLAVIGKCGTVRHTMPLPETPLGILTELREIHRGYEPRAAIEWINPAMFGVGKASMSKLYGSYKELGMALLAAGISTIEVKPKEWQRVLDIPPRKKGMDTGKWKKQLLSVAQKLFPKCEAWDSTIGYQLKVCDALLIAEYSRRKELGLCK